MNWSRNDSSALAFFIPTDGTVTDTGFATNWTYDIEGNEPLISELNTSGETNRIVTGWIGNGAGTTERSIKFIGASGIAAPSIFRKLEAPVVTNGKDGVYTYTFDTKSGISRFSGRADVVAHIGEDIIVGFTWEKISGNGDAGNDGHYIIPYIEIAGTKYISDKKLMVNM